MCKVLVITPEKLGTEERRSVVSRVKKDPRVAHKFPEITFMHASDRKYVKKLLNYNQANPKAIAWK